MRFQVRQAFYMVFSITVAFFIALRVVAHPILLTSPGPGLIALCSGGAIVYVELSSGQPVQNQDGRTAQDCPLIGKALVTQAQAKLDMRAHDFAPWVLRLEVSDRPKGQPVFSKHAPRAPPILT